MFCFGMVSGVDVSPRSTLMTWPSWFLRLRASHSRRFPQGRHGSASHPREAERVSSCEAAGVGLISRHSTIARRASSQHSRFGPPCHTERTQREREREREREGEKERRREKERKTCWLFSSASMIS